MKSVDQLAPTIVHATTSEGYEVVVVPYRSADGLVVLPTRWAAR